MTGSASSSTEILALPSGGVARGVLRPPPSKSLTQRYFLLAALARGPTRVEAPLWAEDTERFLAALARLGATSERGRDAVEIVPGGAVAGGDIDCGDNGTLLRFLTAVLCTRRGRWRLDGSARLRQRPVGPLVAALRSLGAEITCEGEEGFAPLVIRGGTLAGGEAELDAGRSSQYLSALLIAATQAPGATTVRVRELASAPYVDLTVAALERFGGRVERLEGGAFRVPGGQRLAGTAVTVEPDASAACYAAAAAALTGGCVTLAGIGRHSAQGDVRFLDLLARMGARLAWNAGGVEVEGGGELTAIDADFNALPDQAPTLAALGPFATGRTRIRGVPHLRLKESDRLAAMARALTALGAEASERDDGLEVPGVWARRAPPRDAVVVDAAGDHRIAMSLALVGLRRPNLRLTGEASVAKSYPGFWADLHRLVGA